MSQPAKAPEAKVPEPSMDEILASIRRSIVADDDAGKPAPRKSGSRKAASFQPASGGAKGRRVAGEPASAGADGAASQNIDQTLENQTTEASGGEGVVADADPGWVRENNAPNHPGEATGDGEAAAGLPAPDAPLMSPRTTAAIDVAFSSLTNRTVLPQNPRTLEDLVCEMLKPMLKAWLDANLPDMVERLVRAEIERVSRRGERR